MPVYESLCYHIGWLEAEFIDSFIKMDLRERCTAIMFYFGLFLFVRAFAGFGGPNLYNVDEVSEFNISKAQASLSFKLVNMDNGACGGDQAYRECAGATLPGSVSNTTESLPSMAFLDGTRISNQSHDDEKFFWGQFADPPYELPIIDDPRLLNATLPETQFAAPKFLSRVMRNCRDCIH